MVGSRRPGSVDIFNFCFCQRESGWRICESGEGKGNKNEAGRYEGMRLSLQWGVAGWCQNGGGNNGRRILGGCRVGLSRQRTTTTTPTITTLLTTFFD